MQVSRKAVPLHCVFHSIRFKVNKGWSTAVLLFFAHTFLKLSTTEFLVSTATTTTIYHKVPMYKGFERVVVVEFRR